MRYIRYKSIITDGEIVGQEVLDESGNIKRLDNETVLKLVENNMLDGVIAKDENGNKHVWFNNSLSDSTGIEEKYTVEYRILQNGELIGYRCKSLNTGISKRFKASKVWELASEGLIENIEAKTIGTKLVLLGKEEKLEELKTLES